MADESKNVDLGDTGESMDFVYEVPPTPCNISPPKIENGKIVVDKIMTDNDYLYIFIDNLHDFADEGSLNDDKFLDVGVIALCIAYTFAIDQVEINHILNIFKNCLIEVDENISKFFQEDVDIETSFKQFITSDSNTLNAKYKMSDIKTFLTKKDSKNGQRYLYSKIYDSDRFFVKNPYIEETIDRYSNDDITEISIGPQKELTPFVEVVIPDNYLTGEKEADSFVETPAWNALLNASSDTYDGSNVFGEIDFLQEKLISKNPVLSGILNKYQSSIEKKNYATKHVQQIKFDAVYANADVKFDKTYLFAPDAVSKQRAFSSVFHGMQKLHKFGLSKIPTKQTVHNTSINFDMANSNITSPMIPNLGPFQQSIIKGDDDKDIDVNALLEMGIRLNLCSHSGKKKMVIEQIPYKNEKIRTFAHHVYSVYNNMLIYFHEEIKSSFEGRVNNTPEYYKDVEREMIAFLKNTDEGKRFLHSPWTEMDGNEKEENNWTNPEKRQIEIGETKYDILTDIAVKDGTSLYQLMSVEAKDFYQDVVAEDFNPNHKIFLDDTNKHRGQEGNKIKYPLTTKTTGGKIMGPQKFYTSFKKPHKNSNLNDFHSYLLYLFMCDIREIYSDKGEKTYDKDDIPTVDNSVILNVFLEHYKNIIEEDTYLSVAFAVKQNIHFEEYINDSWQVVSDNYGQLKQGKKGPSVTTQEYNFRNLVLSMTKSFHEGATGKENEPLSSLDADYKILNKDLKTFIKENEKRNPLREEKKKDDAGAKRGSNLSKGIKITQNKMIKWLFSKKNGKVKTEYANPDGDGYRSSYHEFILKSIKAANNGSGKLSDLLYKKILGTVLWMPVATKWTSDFMQTIMLHAVLHISKKSNMGYYNNFLPASFDITCASGGIKEGGMMFEMISGNGVLHATNYDPIQHSKRQAQLNYYKKLIRQDNSDDKLFNKFRKTMLNFAPEVIEKYIELLKDSSRLDERDSKFISNFYKYMIEKFDDDRFIINLLLVHTLKKVCYKNEPGQDTLFYQMKYLKELLQNSKNLKPTKFLHSTKDEESQKLVDIIKDLNDTKKTVLKQILNLEIEIDKTKETYTEIYYRDVMQLTVPDIEKKVIEVDPERDFFVESFSKDLNKTLQWQNWNLNQIQKTIDKMIMNLRTRQTLEESIRFFDIGRAEMKTGFKQYEKSSWVNNRSGVLRGDRLFYYYYTEAEKFDIRVLPSTLIRQGTLKSKTGEKISVLGSKDAVEKLGGEDKLNDYFQHTEEIKTSNHPDIVKKRQERETQENAAHDLLSDLDYWLSDEAKEKDNNEHEAAKVLAVFSVVDVDFRSELIKDFNKLRKEYEKKGEKRTDNQLKVEVLKTKRRDNETQPKAEDYDILIGQGFDIFKKKLTKRQKADAKKEGMSHFEKARKEGRLGLGSGESVSDSHPDFKFTTPVQLWNVISKYETKAIKYNDRERTKIIEQATGTGEIWECCHKYLHLPNKKEDIEKIYQKVFDISELREKRKNLEANIKEANDDDKKKLLEDELTEIDKEIETLSMNTIQYTDTMGTLQTKRIIDTHQYKYMDSIDKFNKISNPLVKIKKISDGILKTEGALNNIKENWNKMQSKPSPMRDNMGRTPQRFPANTTPFGTPSYTRTNSGTLTISEQRNPELERLRDEVNLLMLQNEQLQETNLDLQKKLDIVGVETGVRTTNMSGPPRKRQKMDTNQGEGSNQMMMSTAPPQVRRPTSRSIDFSASSSSDNDTNINKGGMKIKIKYNTTQKIKRKKGRKSQNKRKKKGRGSRKHGKRKHRNTRKKALKIEH